MVGSFFILENKLFELVGVEEPLVNHAGATGEGEVILFQLSCRTGRVLHDSSHPLELLSVGRQHIGTLIGP